MWHRIMLPVCFPVTVPVPTPEGGLIGYEPSFIGHTMVIRPNSHELWQWRVSRTQNRIHNLMLFCGAKKIDNWFLMLPPPLERAFKLIIAPYVLIWPTRRSKGRSPLARSKGSSFRFKRIFSIKCFYSRKTGLVSFLSGLESWNRALAGWIYLQVWGGLSGCLLFKIYGFFEYEFGHAAGNPEQGTIEGQNWSRCDLK